MSWQGERAAGTRDLQAVMDGWAEHVTELGLVRASETESVLVSSDELAPIPQGNCKHNTMGFKRCIAM